jgi:3-hydroxyanthranilate 3,4-dioxygenase|tara:strand:- start:1002 stop:1931 length:930 start_codon:yes stop_codon:yes gene_type:complete
MEAVYHLDSWYDANRDLFDPPVCNKLMHKKQLSIMFVGGPNTRTDFHLDQGSEFFWMVRGNMELPTIQGGERKVVKIAEGQVFCLPSRIPHSPQRPEDGSLGLVIERERYVHGEFGIEEPELDGLRWFVDFENTKGADVLWEKYFHCYDLGRDLVPVVKQFHASEEKVSRTPTPGVSVLTDAARPFVVDKTTLVPDPFDLKTWIVEHAAELASSPGGVNLFGDTHPDGEFKVLVCAGDAEYAPWEGDTWVFQIEGNCNVSMNGETNPTNAQQLLEGVSGIVPPNTPFRITRGAGRSVGFVIRNDPRGNK